MTSCAKISRSPQRKIKRSRNFPPILIIGYTAEGKTAAELPPYPPFGTASFTYFSYSVPVGYADREVGTVKIVKIDKKERIHNELT